MLACQGFCLIQVYCSIHVYIFFYFHSNSLFEKFQGVKVEDDLTFKFQHIGTR